MSEYNACIIFSHLIHHLHYLVQEESKFALDRMFWNSYCMSSIA